MGENQSTGENKKTTFLLAAINIWVFFLTIAAAFLYYSYNLAKGTWASEEIASPAKTIIAAASGILGYIVLHESTHAAVMRLFGARHIEVRLNWKYIWIGASDKYFSKPEYVLIALAPLLIWTPVFLILGLRFRAWFWMFSVLEAVNLSGSVNDVFLSAKALRLPKKAMIKDSSDGRQEYKQK